MFIDANAEGVKTLYKKEAFKRSSEVQDVFYKLAYALNRGGDTFEGQVIINFSLTSEGKNSDDIFVDYRGKSLHTLEINGTTITQGEPFHDHRIYFDKQWLKEGRNEVLIRFTSNYVRDCQGVQYFKDKDDGEEYLYSDHEPASCHRGFPCFDQPDIKSTYTMITVVPKGWHVMSNAE